MRRIDELHVERPFYGSRRMAHALQTEGKPINRTCVQRLMCVMDLEALAPKPNRAG